jgi:SpoVK/Ycf46/Vps4 family AAA+-type ATPase
MQFYRSIFFSFLISMSCQVYTMEIDETEASNIIPIWRNERNENNKSSQGDEMRNSLNCVRPINEIDPFLVDEVIRNCPLKLQKIVRNLKAKNNGFPKRGRIPKSIILLGEPGVGKSTLAQAIAVYCSSKATFVKLTDIHDKFKDSGSHNLCEIFRSIRHETDPHIIILDEIQCLVKKRNHNEKDEDAAKTLWSALDEIERKSNIMVIGTANKIKNLPQQLRNRLSTSTFIIDFPSDETRERIIRYYLSVMPNHIKLKISDSEIKQLIKNTKGLGARDLQKIIEDGCNDADLDGPDILDIGEFITVTVQDFERVIVLVKENNGTYKVWYEVGIYKYIKPHIGMILQIGIPLIINLTANYLIQKIALQKQLIVSANQYQKSAELATRHHDENMKQQVLFHQQSLNQGESFQKQQLEQSSISQETNINLSKKNNQEQLNQSTAHFNKTLKTNIVFSLAGFAIQILPKILGGVIF